MMEIAGVVVPHTLEELTVRQFDQLNAITKDESLDNIDKWIAKFTYLGVPEEEFDAMPFDEFKEYIRTYNDLTYSTEKILSFELDGYTYETNEQIGTKDLGLIEKAWKAKTNYFSAEMLAILFKRTDLSRNEHYTTAHLKHKTKIFGDLSAKYSMPFVVDVLTQITNTAKKLNNEPTEELEGSNG
jgi:hypothetical protein